jgi:hypothetical protein
MIEVHIYLRTTGTKIQVQRISKCVAPEQVIFETATQTWHKAGHGWLLFVG